MESVTRDYLGGFNVLFVTCFLFVIHSANGTLGTQHMERNQFVGEELFSKPRHFLKDCTERVTETEFQTARAVGTVGLAAPPWGAKGMEKELGTPKTQRLLGLKQEQVLKKLPEPLLSLLRRVPQSQGFHSILCSHIDMTLYTVCCRGWEIEVWFKMTKIPKDQHPQQWPGLGI